MKQKINRFCAMLMLPFMVVLNCPLTAIGAEAEAPVVSIEITHAPVEEVIAGQRIAIGAKIADLAGVDIVRVYFKTQEASNYNFIKLSRIDKAKKTYSEQFKTYYEQFKSLGSESQGDAYYGQLPAPANGTKIIDYLILVKNGNNQVVKSQTYRITVVDDNDASQAVAEKDQIQVYTELQQAPTEVTGFSDNIAIDVVESGAKLGVVVGLYSAATAGGSTSAAVAGGTVAASTGGFSTTAMVIGGVAAAVVVGGVAIAASGGGGGGDAQDLTAQTVLGKWNVTENSLKYTLTFLNNGRYSIDSGTSPGSWNLTGDTMTIRPDHGGVWTGTVSGNSKSFTMTGNTTAYFTR